MTTATTRTVQQSAELLVAAAFAGVTQLEVWVFTLGDYHPVWVRVAASLLTLVASGSLALRRSRPPASLSVRRPPVNGDRLTD